MRIHLKINTYVITLHYIFLLNKLNTEDVYIKKYIHIKHYIHIKKYILIKQSHKGSKK